MEYRQHASSSGRASPSPVSGPSPAHRATARRLPPRACRVTSRRPLKSTLILICCLLFSLVFLGEGSCILSFRGVAWIFTGCVRASFWFAPFRFFPLFSGRAPSAAPFFRPLSGCLHPPSLRFASWLPEARRQAPIFSARPSFPKPAHAIFPCSVRTLPSHLRLSWPWHTPNGGRRSDSPCRSCRNPPASQMGQHLVFFVSFYPVFCDGLTW